MTTITFDTLQLVQQLKNSGFEQLQAEAIIKVLADAQDSLVTKRDLKDAFNDFKETAIAPLKTEITVIKTDIAVLKWMMGIVIAGILSLVLKAFF